MKKGLEALLAGRDVISSVIGHCWYLEKRTRKRERITRRSIKERKENRRSPTGCADKQYRGLSKLAERRDHNQLIENVKYEHNLRGENVS